MLRAGKDYLAADEYGESGGWPQVVAVGPELTVAEAIALGYIRLDTNDALTSKGEQL